MVAVRGRSSMAQCNEVNRLSRTKGVKESSSGRLDSRSATRLSACGTHRQAPAAQPSRSLLPLRVIRATPCAPGGRAPAPPAACVPVAPSLRRSARHTGCSLPPDGGQPVRQPSTAGSRWLHQRRDTLDVAGVRLPASGRCEEMKVSAAVFAPARASHVRASRLAIVASWMFCAFRPCVRE